MELKISIFKRDLSYKLDNKHGVGLDELIRECSGVCLDSIEITGESRSYTFMRQVALFVNLSTSLNQCRLINNSKSFKSSDNKLAPIYE